MIQIDNLHAGLYPKAYQLLAQAVQSTGAGKAFWALCEQSPNTHLIFEDVQLAEKEFAFTRFEIGNKHLHALDSDPEVDFLTQQLRTAVLNVRIGFNPTWAGAHNLGFALETMVHEFALHAADYGHLIKALRDPQLSEMELNKFYRVLGGPLGLLTKDAGHFFIASVTSKRFLVLADYLKKNLASPDAQSFQKEIEEDSSRQLRQEFDGNLETFRAIYARLAASTFSYPGASLAPAVDDAHFASTPFPEQLAQLIKSASGTSLAQQPAQPGKKTVSSSPKTPAPANTTTSTSLSASLNRSTSSIPPQAAGSLVSSEVIGVFWDVVQRNFYLQDLIQAQHIQVVAGGRQEVLDTDTPQHMSAQELRTAYWQLCQIEQQQVRWLNQILQLVQDDTVLQVMIDQQKFFMKGRTEPVSMKDICYASPATLQVILSALQELHHIQPGARRQPPNENCIVS
ncbi:hypothetical protein [Tengunoibacter tsumagoiensis]|uniref:Uncharacterized protein n=1 Tax=Tengunoibacter tsumagoiensis TaxID=2014871 RepID=A0A402A1B5_9CHLR|nr:hypothetical protein [Tengunoibacter tsumagoiensis]GCE12937.1 hypothetical protein KTT_27960 [Tengunoibacter tsumagoiensis]